MSSSIYLDYAATTPVDESVASEMMRCLSFSGTFGNPSSSEHSHGKEAEHIVELARERIAKVLFVSPNEIAFTSGATESDNLAIVGAALGMQSKGRHLITVKSEHKAVLSSFQYLERNGFDVTYLPLDEFGRIGLAKLQDSIRPDTTLISIMYVNNETGVVQDLEGIVKIKNRTEALLHVDAAQAFGKLPIDLSKLDIDLMSISAHKIYGPKGVGALFARRSIRDQIVPIIQGGGQEQGLRPGTLATHQIAGLGAAAELAAQRSESDLRLARELSDCFLATISGLPDWVLNGDQLNRLPNILNISFLGVDASALLLALPDLSLSTSSACSSGTVEPSHVLRAMGIEEDRLYGAVRVSFGRYSTLSDAKYAAVRIKKEVQRLRQLNY